MSPLDGLSHSSYEKFTKDKDGRKMAANPAPGSVGTGPHDDFEDEYFVDAGSTSLVSLMTRSAYFAFDVRHRREYHPSAPYPMPVDERAQELHALEHEMMTLAADGRLYFAPIDGNPQRILDVGTGPGGSSHNQAREPFLPWTSLSAV